MKVVLISDTHGFEPKVPDGDILIHAGDLTSKGTHNQISAAGSWLRSLPHKYKIVIAGNHDFLFERNQADALSMLGSGFVYLENSSVTIEGIKIYGSPVTPRFYDWAFNVDRGEPLRKYWDTIPEDTDILVTHGPPKGVLDQASASMNTFHCGCEELLLALKRIHPKIHVFGHIHGGHGKHEMSYGTTCYNASMVDEAYKIGPEAFTVEL